MSSFTDSLFSGLDTPDLTSSQGNTGGDKGGYRNANGQFIPENKPLIDSTVTLPTEVNSQTSVDNANVLPEISPIIESNTVDTSNVLPDIKIKGSSFADSLFNTEPSVPHSESNIDTLKSFGSGLGDMLGGAYDSVKGIFGRAVLNEDKSKGINNLSEYTKSMAEYDKLGKAGDKQGQVLAYKKMIDNNIIDEDKFNEYNNSLSDKVDTIDYKKTISDEFIGSVKSKLSETQDKYTQDLIYKGSTELADQLDGINTIIDSSFEGGDFNKNYWFGKLEGIKDKNKEFFQEFSRQLLINPNDGQAYDAVIAQDKYKKIAEDTSDFYLDVRNASVGAAKTHYANEFLGDSNTLQKIGDFYMTFSNVVSDVVNRAGSGLEIAKRNTLGMYDVTEDLAHLNVYKDNASWFSNGGKFVGNTFAELIDGAPQFVPEVLGMVFGGKGISKIGKISGLSKAINTINNPLLKKSTVAIKEMSKDLIAFDIIGGGFLDRGRNTEDVMADLLISGPINAVIGSLARVQKSNNVLFNDTKLRFTTGESYIDDEILDLYKSGKVNEAKTLSIKGLEEGKVSNVNRYSDGYVSQFKDQLTNLSNRINKGEASSSDIMVVKTAGDSKRRGYNNDITKEVLNQNIKTAYDIIGKSIQGDTSILAKQVITFIKNGKTVNPNYKYLGFLGSIDNLKLTGLNKFEPEVQQYIKDSIHNIFGQSGRDLTKYDNIIADKTKSQIGQIRESLVKTIIELGNKEVVNNGLIPNGSIFGKYVMTDSGLKNIVTNKNISNKSVIKGLNNEGNFINDTYESLINVNSNMKKGDIVDITNFIGLGDIIKSSDVRFGDLFNSVLNNILKDLGLKFESGGVFGSKSDIDNIILHINNFKLSKGASLSQGEMGILKLMNFKSEYLKFESNNSYDGSKNLTLKLFNEKSIFRLWTKDDKGIYNINIKNGNKDKINTYISDTIKSDSNSQDISESLNNIKNIDTIISSRNSGKSDKTQIKEALDNSKLLGLESNKSVLNKFQGAMNSFVDTLSSGGKGLDAGVLALIKDGVLLTPAVVYEIVNYDKESQSPLINDILYTLLMGSRTGRLLLKRKVISKYPNIVKDISKIEGNIKDKFKGSLIDIKKSDIILTVTNEIKKTDVEIVRGIKYDIFNKAGFDSKGYDKKGFNIKGYNREGFNIKGYNREGYSIEGYNVKGINKHGRTKEEEKMFLKDISFINKNDITNPVIKKVDIISTNIDDISNIKKSLFKNDSNKFEPITIKTKAQSNVLIKDLINDIQQQISKLNDYELIEERLKAFIPVSKILNDRLIKIINSGNKDFLKNNTLVIGKLKLAIDDLSSSITLNDITNRAKGGDVDKVYEEYYGKLLKEVLGEGDKLDTAYIEHKVISNYYNNIFSKYKTNYIKEDTDTYRYIFNSNKGIEYIDTNSSLISDRVKDIIGDVNTKKYYVYNDIYNNTKTDYTGKFNIDTIGGNIELIPISRILNGDFKIKGDKNILIGKATYNNFFKVEYGKTFLLDSNLDYRYLNKTKEGLNNINKFLSLNISGLDLNLTKVEGEQQVSFDQSGFGALGREFNDLGILSESDIVFNNKYDGQVFAFLSEDSSLDMFRFQEYMMNDFIEHYGEDTLKLIQQNGDANSIYKLIKNSNIDNKTTVKGKDVLDSLTNIGYLSGRFIAILRSTLGEEKYLDLLSREIPLNNVVLNSNIFKTTIDDVIFSIKGNLNNIEKIKSFKNNNKKIFDNLENINNKEDKIYYLASELGKTGNYSMLKLLIQEKAYELSINPYRLISKLPHYISSRLYQPIDLLMINSVMAGILKSIGEDSKGLIKKFNNELDKVKDKIIFEHYLGDNNEKLVSSKIKKQIENKYKSLGQFDYGSKLYNTVKSEIDTLDRYKSYINNGGLNKTVIYNLLVTLNSAGLISNKVDLFRAVETIDPKLRKQILNNIKTLSSTTLADIDLLHEILRDKIVELINNIDVFSKSLKIFGDDAPNYIDSEVANLRGGKIDILDSIVDGALSNITDNIKGMGKQLGERIHMSPRYHIPYDNISTLESFAINPFNFKIIAKNALDKGINKDNLFKGVNNFFKQNILNYKKMIDTKGELYTVSNSIKFFNTLNITPKSFYNFFNKLGKIENKIYIDVLDKDTGKYKQVDFSYNMRDLINSKGVFTSKFYQLLSLIFKKQNDIESNINKGKKSSKYSILQIFDKNGKLIKDYNNKNIVVHPIMSIIRDVFKVKFDSDMIALGQKLYNSIRGLSRLNKPILSERDISRNYLKKILSEYIMSKKITGGIKGGDKFSNQIFKESLINDLKDALLDEYLYIKGKKISLNNLRNTVYKLGSNIGNKSKNDIKKFGDKLEKFQSFVEKNRADGNIFSDNYILLGNKKVKAKKLIDDISFSLNNIFSYKKVNEIYTELPNTKINDKGEIEDFVTKHNIEVEVDNEWNDKLKGAEDFYSANGGDTSKQVNEVTIGNGLDNMIPGMGFVMRTKFHGDIKIEMNKDGKILLSQVDEIISKPKVSKNIDDFSKKVDTIRQEHCPFNDFN